MPMNRASSNVDMQRYQAVAMLTDALSNLLNRTSGLSYSTRIGLMADDAVALTVATLTDEIQLLLPRTPEQSGAVPAAIATPADAQP